MRTTKGESINAHEGGGSSCSSVEGSVMGLERRGWASSQQAMVNPAKAGEEPGSFCVGLRPWGLKRKAGRSGMTGDCHVPICEGLGVKFPRATRPYLRFWISRKLVILILYHKHNRPLIPSPSRLYIIGWNIHFCQIVGFGYKSAISNLPIYFWFYPSIQFDEYPGTQECAIFCYKFVTDKKI